MIISIPENKIIKHSLNYKKLNESLFDDDEDELLGTDDEIAQDAFNDIISKEIVKDNIPKVERILQQLDVENYEIVVTNSIKLQVNVHDHLFLPGRKLDRFSNNIFEFNTVDGNCNFSNNDLNNWSFFPKVIKGNCYANFNNIRNFNGVPQILGNIIASKQKVKTQYPLTKENYIKFKNNTITENSVYALPVNRFGTIYSLCEEDNSCIIKFNDNTKQKFKLNEVEYLGNIENLLK